MTKRKRAGRRAIGAALLGLVWCAAAAGQVGGVREPALDRDEARRLAPAEATAGAAGAPPVVPYREERRRLAELRRILAPQSLPEAAVRIRAIEGFLEESEGMIYGPGRTQIVYGPYFLEADKVIFDQRQLEIQAEGDVILRVGEDTIRARSLRYNFSRNEGVAYDVTGAHPPIYYRSRTRPDGLPQLQRVSPEESLFRHVDMTSCNFPVPHFFVRGREVVLFQDDRVFIRGATLYVGGVPVFYLPVYSRSLREASPWGTQLGYNSRTGFRIRESYTYHHRLDEPSLEDDSVYETRSQGRADIFVDYLTRKGLGGGMRYDYRFEFDRQRGEMAVYGLSDSDRRVVGAEPIPDAPRFSESRRWQFEWRHRAELTRDLSLLINIDEFSDPDIFYDVLDLFGDGQDQRDRQVERRARVALTWVQEAYVARLMADITHRVGLDRWNDFSNPRDDNFDFDLDPTRRLDDADVDGISQKRWGMVSRRAPQFTLATRYLPLGNRPLYYSFDLNLYRALDKGLNNLGTEDDDVVEGAEFYQQLLTQWKLSQRLVLLWRAGFGVGHADRNATLGVRLPEAPVFPLVIDGLTLVDDRGTFLLGTRERNLSQIEPTYVWADTELRLVARFSNALRGDIGWRYRYTTDDFIGDWYAQLGSQTFRSDLYDYRIREHWIDANLSYRLARPLLTLWATAAHNLTGKGDLYSKEDIGYVRAGYSWSSLRQTGVHSGWAGLRRQQIFDPSDPAAFEETIWEGAWQISYSPVHQRWYTLLRVSYRNSLHGNVESSDDPRKTFFSDERAKTAVRWTYGRELGPKWDMEYTIEWDEQVGGLRETALLLQRDLHDAVGILRLALRNDPRRVNDARDQQANEVDVRLGIRFKLPEQEVSFGSGDIQTLRERSREPALAY